ncbi:MAG: hypothetical protein KDD77_11040, partial [Caldilineaceae bacterium]|nr:hypothetical protein [Caldilineaceae bacterium]
TGWQALKSISASSSPPTSKGISEYFDTVFSFCQTSDELAASHDSHRSTPAIRRRTGEACRS